VQERLCGRDPRESELSSARCSRIYMSLGTVEGPSDRVCSRRPGKMGMLGTEMWPLS
jgi:hypothetical protein